jgi:SAM-dependent methyltransferase
VTLRLTGERTLPDIAEENYWFRRHEAAYLLLSPVVSGGSLLEVGAGEGYGAALLASQAAFTCALDYDASAIHHLSQRYPLLHAVRANLAALPFVSGSFDFVVSLQVIEHVWDHRQFLRECGRVLVPGGQLVLSTPNRLTFSPGSDVPLNPFHTHEFVAAELVSLVSSCGFSAISVLGLHPSARLRGLDAKYGGFVSAQLAIGSESWSAELAADVASVTSDDFSLSSSDLDASLDLIVLARPT